MAEDTEQFIRWDDESGKLEEILKLTIAIEGAARDFYAELGVSTSDKTQAAFWARMAGEEHEHLFFWTKALELAEKGMLPHVFDSPDEMVRELHIIKRSVLALFRKGTGYGRDIREALLVAFRLEFYNIHSVLLPLLQSLKGLVHGRCPYDNYDTHLSAFIEMYKKCHGVAGPEIQLLGEVIQRLWKDNLQLSRQCSVDELTGLLNRRGFTQASLPLLSLAQRSVSTIAFMMADIDHFKHVNDTYGHQCGDAVLGIVGQALRSSLRGSDVMARYGGEEFIIFLPALSDGSLKKTAEKVRKAVESADNGAIKVTISIGAVEAVPPVGMPAVEIMARLCKSADSFLYKAKANGRNRVECGTFSFLT